MSTTVGVGQVEDVAVTSIIEKFGEDWSLKELSKHHGVHPAEILEALEAFFPGLGFTIGGCLLDEAQRTRNPLEDCL